VRVPLLNASLTDCVFEMERSTSVEEVNGLFATGRRAARRHPRLRDPAARLGGFRARSTLAIVDAPSTMVVNGTQVKVFAWYDNEWGYACRMADIARMMLERW
jgi:glyceraldehyde 3-phosphate dehydrogenase